MTGQVGEETYVITDAGESAPTDPGCFDISDGYFEIGSSLSIPSERINDTSGLSQVNVKKQNTVFFLDTEHDYSFRRRDPRRQRDRIWRTKKWKVDRLMEEFPRTEHVVSQCAHWMRSIVGLHLFPDANHRTGMATLSRLMIDNNIIDRTHPWPGEQIGKAVLLSKFHRETASVVDFSTIWRRDTLYWHWHQYFDHILNDAFYPALSKHSEAALRRKLQSVRGR